MTSFQDISGVSCANSALTSRSRLRTKSMWYNGLRCGQGFFDPHEGTIEYHIVPHDSYASFIECGAVRLDVDESGSPVMVDIDLQGNRIHIDDSIIAPIPQLLYRLRFLDFPIKTQLSHLRLLPDNSLCHIVFSRLIPTSFHSFSPGAIWEVDSGSCVVGLWLTDLIADPSGRQRAEWRASVWQAYRRGRLQEIASINGRLETGWLSAPKIFP